MKNKNNLKGNALGALDDKAFRLAESPALEVFGPEPEYFESGDAESPALEAFGPKPEYFESGDDIGRPDGGSLGHPDYPRPTTTTKSGEASPDLVMSKATDKPQGSKGKPSKKEETFSLLKEYRKTREYLSGDPTILEVKHHSISEEFVEGLSFNPSQELWLNNDANSTALVGPLETFTAVLYGSRTLKGSRSVEYTSVSGMVPLNAHLSLLRSCGIDPHKGGRILILNGNLLVSESWFTDREGLKMLLGAGAKGYGKSGKELYRRDVQRGLFSWSTRGQISEEMNLKACTGLRTSDMTIGEAQELITSNRSDFMGREIDYITSSLRSASDLVKYKSSKPEICSFSQGGWTHSISTKGKMPSDLSVKSKWKDSSGHYKIIDDNVNVRMEQRKDSLHVTMQYSDQTFRVKYNNCRRTIFPNDPLYDHNYYGMIQTVPWKSIEEALLVRQISKLASGTGIYSKTTGTTFPKKYKSMAELGIRSFIKDVVNSRNGVSLDQFKGYGDLSSFINKWIFFNHVKVGRGIDSKYISVCKLLSRGKIPKRKTLPDIPVIRSFLLYVKSRFCLYDPSVLLKPIVGPITEKELEEYKEEENTYGKYENGRTKFNSETYFNVWDFLDVATERAEVD
jgi:hypothetical protein